TGVRAVSPVDEGANRGVLNRPELGDGLIGPGQESFDDIGLSPQFLEGLLQLRGGLADLWPRPLVRSGPVVARPENRNLLHAQLSMKEAKGRQCGIRGRGRVWQGEKYYAGTQVPHTNPTRQRGTPERGPLPGASG